jgi:tetraacyldisaccharide 4'-kinase
VAAAKLLVEQGVDVVVSDDGLQHLRLRRDFEIVVVDGERGFGNGRLLPAGPLREDAARLRRVSTVVVNGELGTVARAQLRAVVKPLVMQMQPGQAHSLFGLPAKAISSFVGGHVHAVAAIGNPERFFRTLERAGLTINRHAWPDHYRLTRDDIVFDDGMPVLMTEKDATRCRQFADERHWFLAVDVQWQDDDGERLFDQVSRSLKARKGEAVGQRACK